MGGMRVILGIFRLLAAAALVYGAHDWRAPLFASIRYAVLAGLIALSLALIVAELWAMRSPASRKLPRALSLMTLLMAALVLAWTLAIEARFQWLRHAVLNADASELEPLGRHFIVGYRNAEALKALIERRAIAGVFLAAPNVAQRSAAEIAGEIAGWQEIRRRQGLPALWISTDQEGGSVSRMSPPLPRQSSLAEVVAAQTDSAGRARAIRDYAAEQGQALRTLGVNLDFAPVVDVNHRVISAGDRYSQIYRRAISEDPQIIAQAASVYCLGLHDNGVGCTLKHFPGLGRVVTDTHLDDADLDVPLATLMQTDWVPFCALMENQAPFVMLGHVRLTAIDRERPASFSPAVIDGLLRGDWRFRGVLITDDASMGAFYGSAWGITGGALQALNAGVDLILISYDPDQYFPVMYSLLQAARAGLLRADRLSESDRRLDAAAQP